MSREYYFTILSIAILPHSIHLLNLLESQNFRVFHFILQ